jgi:hypothetical protein
MILSNANSYGNGNRNSYLYSNAYRYGNIHAYSYGYGDRRSCDGTSRQ